MESSEAFDRVAQVAARLFLSRGYTAVSLRDIARELGIKPASLYYHCPNGKAELYARSLELYLEGYQRGLTSARGRARFPEALHRMTAFMLESPPVDLQRIVRVDLPNLDESEASGLIGQLHAAVLEPFSTVLEAAIAAGTVKASVDPGLVAACIVALVDGLGFLHLPPGRKPSPDELRAARRTVRAGVSLVIDGGRSSEKR